MVPALSPLPAGVLRLMSFIQDGRRQGAPGLAATGLSATNTVHWASIARVQPELARADAGFDRNRSVICFSFGGPAFKHEPETNNLSIGSTVGQATDGYS